MRRVLITGASGFAGRWLARACAEEGDEVVGASRSGATGGEPGVTGRALDLRVPRSVAELVADVEPEVVYHLAALSHVGRSWQEPAQTLEVGVLGSASLLEALREHAPKARVVWVSSCEVYGPGQALPVRESAAPNPASPYAVAKAAGEMLARVYQEAHGLDVVCVRPFNHAGPGQRPIFLVSSLAHQGASARLAGQERVRIVTGNPDTRRDFTDVRDVVDAYRRLAEPGVPAGVYNVSTGRSVSAAEQVALLAELIAPIEVEHVVDPARVRAHEVMDFRGSHERVSAATGWEPQIPLRQTIADTIEWWERELSVVR